MAGELILNDLKKSKLEDIDQAVKDYLGPTFLENSSLKSSQLGNYGLFSVRFLHGSVAILDGLTSQQLSPLVRALAVCCQCVFVQKDHIKLKEPLTVQKVLYHLVVKILNKQDQDNALLFADILLGEIKETPDEHTETILTIAKNTYTTLWNNAFQLENTKSSPGPCPYIIMRLRHTALKFLVHTDKPLALLVERAIVTMGKFEAETLKQGKGKAQGRAGALEEIDGVFQSVSGMVKHRLVSSEKTTSENSCLLLEFILYHTRILIKHEELTKCLNLLESNFQTNGCLKNSSSSSLFIECLNLCKITVLLRRYLYCERTTNEDQSLEATISHLLESSNANVQKLLSTELENSWLTQLLETYILLRHQLPTFNKSKCLIQMSPSIQDEVLRAMETLGNLLRKHREFLQASSSKPESDESTGKKLYLAVNRLVETESIKLDILLDKLRLLLPSGSRSVASDESLMSLLSRATAIFSSLSDLLASAPPNGSGSPLNKEHYHSGLLATKFAHALYECDLYEEAKQFYSLACQHFSTWCQQDSSGKRNIEVQLWRRYSYLVDCQRKTGEMQEAMNTVLTGLRADPHNITSAAETWAKIKRDIAKLGTHQELKTRTMRQCLAGQGQDYGMICVASLQEEELLAYKSLRPRAVEEQEALVEDMLLTCPAATHPQRRACALIEKAQLLWAKAQPVGVVLACCDEAIGLLEGLKASKASPCSQDDLARAYLWQYLALAEQAKQQVSTVSLVNKKTGEEKETSPTSLESTIVLESQPLASLDKALQIWSDLVASANGSANVFRNLATTIESLQLVASVYRLIEKLLDEHRAVSLVLQLAVEHSKTGTAVTAGSRIIQILCELGQVDQASACLEKHQTWITGSSTDYTLNILFLVAKAQLFLLSKKIPEGHQAIQEARELRETHIKDKTKDMHLLDGMIKRLYSRFLRLPSCQLGEPAPASTAIDMAHEAVRQHTGVANFVFGNDLSGQSLLVVQPDTGSNSTNGLTVLSELLTTYMDIGQLFVQIGEARQAKCYLLEGLKLAQGFNLPRRIASFLLQLSHVENLRGRYLDGQANLTNVNYILNSKNTERNTTSTPPALAVTPTKPTKNNKETKAKKEKRNSCFGFNDDEDEDDFIMTLPKADSDEESEEFSGRDLASSPTLQHFQAPLPDYASHSTGCECRHCTDVLLSRYNLQYILQEAENLKVRGETVNATKTLKTALKFHADLKPKISATILSATGTVAANSINGKKKPTKGKKLAIDPIKGGFGSDLLVEVYVELAELCFEEGDVSQVSEWIEKGLEMIQAESSLAEQYQSEIELRYLRCLVLLVNDATKESQDLEQLCQLIQTISLDEQQPVNVGRKGLTSKTSRRGSQSARSSSSASNVSASSDAEIIAEVPDTNPRRRRGQGSKGHRLSDAAQEHNPEKVLTVAYKTPARKIRSRKLNNPAPLPTNLFDDDDDCEMFTPETTVVTSFKTPARRMKARTSNQGDAFKTPMSTIVIADENGDSIPKTAAAGSRRVSKSAVAKPQAKSTVRRGAARKDADTGSKTCIAGKPKPLGNSDVNKAKGLSQSLFSSTVKKNDINSIGSENFDIYDFPDSPSVSNSTKVKAKGRSGVKSAKGKKSDNQKESAVEKSVKAVRVKSRTTRGRQCATADMEMDRALLEENLMGLIPSVSELASPVHVNPVLDAAASPSAPTSRVNSECKINIRKVSFAETPCAQQETTALTTLDLRHLQTSKAQLLNDEPVCSDYHISPEDSVADGACNLDDSVEVLRACSESEEEAPIRRKAKRKAPARKTAARKEKAPGPVDGEDESVQGTDAAWVKKELEECQQLLQHCPPSTLYRRVCHALALASLVEHPSHAAAYLSEAMAVSFRHIALANLTKKIRKMKKEERSGEETEEGDKFLLEQLEQARNTMAFTPAVKNYQSLINSIPEGWTVCQVSEVHRGEKSSVVISRLQHGMEPVVLELPSAFTNQGGSLLADFASLMQESKESMQVTDKVEWWQRRRELDEKMRTVIERMQECWLGGWKGALLGALSGTEERDKLRQAVAAAKTEVDCILGGEGVDSRKLQCVLEGGSLCSDAQLVSTLAQLCPTHQQEQLQAISRAVKNQSRTLQNTQAQRLPVILILDKNIQQLPWESMPILQDQVVTRMPSLHFLAAHLTLLATNQSSALSKGVDPASTFYVLNPENNLHNTQERFQAWFEKQKRWKGVTGEAPSAEQFTAGLIEHDLFIYCGHGGGSKFLTGDMIQTLQCHATALLVGCSSGRLVVEGALEAYGLTLSYFMAGCPSMLANLWDVTDKDIDRFFEELLKAWLASKTGTTLSSLMQQARKACKMTHLIGAAPVIYGVPVKLQK